MSHFTILVTKTNKVPLEDQLAPFYAELKVPRYVACTKEQLIARERTEFEEDRDAYTEFLADPEGYKARTANERYCNFLEHEFPQRLHWTDEDFYNEAIKYQDKENITPEGGLYSTSNPNDRWDWYTIGGRWLGYFKLKLGATGRLGTSGIDDNKPLYDADVAFVKDIDWQGMVEAKREKAQWYWVEVEKKQANGDDVSLYIDFVIEPDETKEHFINRGGSAATLAVIHDGEWYEQGEMNSFLEPATGPSIEEWHEQFDTIIQSLDPDDEVTLVDCHY